MNYLAVLRVTQFLIFFQRAYSTKICITKIQIPIYYESGKRKTTNNFQCLHLSNETVLIKKLSLRNYLRLNHNILSTTMKPLF